MERVAIYAGSFDPVTVGHVDVMQRASSLFDRLIIAVGNNPAKKYLFDLEERTSLIERSLESVKGVEVVAFSGLLVDTARARGATVILRGLRALSDFELEFRNGLANRDLSGLETMFLLSSPRFVYVSSSLVKEVASSGGDVSRWVPAPVLSALQQRYPR